MFIDLKVKLEELCVSLEAEIDALRYFFEQAASAEHSYRSSKAKAWGFVPKINKDGSQRSALEVEADVESLTADLRYARDLAEGNKQTCLESVKAKSQQIALFSADLP